MNGHHSGLAGASCCGCGCSLLILVTAGAVWLTVRAVRP